LAVAVVGGLEGVLAGGAMGGLAIALMSVGVSKKQAILSESQIKAGKFDVTL